MQVEKSEGFQWLFQQRTTLQYSNEFQKKNTSSTFIYDVALLVVWHRYNQGTANNYITTMWRVCKQCSYTRQHVLGRLNLKLLNQPVVQVHQGYPSTLFKNIIIVLTPYLNLRFNCYPIFWVYKARELKLSPAYLDKNLFKDWASVNIRLTGYRFLKE